MNLITRTFRMDTLILLIIYMVTAWAAPVGKEKSLTSSFDGCSNVTYPLPSDVVYEFPEDTLVENLAVRHNGQIIVTENTRPRVYQVDLFMSQKAILLHEFP